MSTERTLVSDDERLSFARELGWDPDDQAADGDLATRAHAFFQIDALEGKTDEATLEGVDQPLLDEVRDAVLRRAQI